VEDAHEIMFFSLRHAATVTIKEMHAFGAQKNNKRATLIAAQFLHEELPIRIARRARELKKLPHNLGEMPSIVEVRKLYEESFFRLRRMPCPKTNKMEEEFTAMLDNMMTQHNSVQQIVASGLQELNDHLATETRAGLYNPTADYDFGQFLDRFYLSRVGMRVLVGQHIMLHHPQEGFIGIIQSECQPAAVCKHAVDDAKMICELSYGVAPEVRLLGATDMKLPYIPEHLHYIFFELIKNSMRAVVERHGPDVALPPVEVVFAEGIEDIAIKISDKGGGIPRSGMDRLWSYSFTTAGGTAEKIERSKSGDKRPVMAGFAHGLPLSRIHARAFGGDVQVMSLEGHGTDVYIYLWKLGDREVPVP